MSVTAIRWSLLVVSKDEPFVQSLCSVLAASGRFDPIAATSTEVSHLIDCGSLDLLLVDVAIGSVKVLSLARKVERLNSRAKVILLGADEDDPCILDFLEAGINAFLPKSASFEELVAGAEAVQVGDAVCSPRTAFLALSHLAKLASHSAVHHWVTSAGLSVREMEVLNLLAGDLSNDEISEELGISLSTVKNHIHRILGKLQVRNRCEAAASMARIITSRSAR